MPPGTLVPRDWLLDQLSGVDAARVTSIALVDLTIPDLAKMFGKRPSTVRAWVERGDFGGAYKLHGKEWRVPADSVRQFQEQQRRR
jgi:helix-turn-helix protein